MIQIINKTTDHILSLSLRFCTREAHLMVMTLLIELGFPMKLRGFDYLVKGICLYHEDPLQTITKDLYPAIASMYREQITPTQVEQSIRTAIGAAWKKRKDDDWIRYFPPDMDGKMKKPSNTEFISCVARALEFWKGCCPVSESDTSGEEGSAWKN